MYCSARILHQSPVTPPKSTSPSCSALPNRSTNPTLRWRRRDFTSSSLLLLQVIDLKEPSATRAEPINDESGTVPTNSSCIEPKNLTDRAFLDISIDGDPVGRIIIGLYGDAVPAGAARLADLVSGKSGVSYRRKEFVKILTNYVQHGGLRSFGVDAELVTKTGSNSSKVNGLLEEWKKQNAAATIDSSCKVKNERRSVSLIVRNPERPPPKLKLIARDGKLEIDEEEIGSDPNGTEFVIAVNDSPELDSSALVVGRVLDGMEVVERIGRVKTVQENSSSPYFRVAKLIGDKRAVVAERGFNRPYSKVVITNCGLMEWNRVDQG